VRSLRPYLAALFLLGASALPVVAAQPSAANAARAEHDRIVAYWTPARIASAQARDFVRTVSGSYKPYARPGGGGVAGASWPNGKGAISASEGKVYFSMGGGNWQCSGTPVSGHTQIGYALVLTAGHCAVDETTGEFATNWMFIPAWDAKPATFNSACSAGATTYGCWTSSALVVDSGFATAGGFNSQATRHDWALAVVGTGGFANGDLESKVTSFALNVSSVAAGQPVSAFGFPAAGKYHGNDLTYCSGNAFTDSWNANKTFGLACDMTGGSSGGGWMAPFTPNTGTGQLGGLNSYGYSGVKNMYGPDFNGNTTAVFNDAKTRTVGNNVVAVAP
jgi:V8-like Glu-specific endopeptidase